MQPIVPYSVPAGTLSAHSSPMPLVQFGLENIRIKYPNNKIINKTDSENQPFMRT